MPAGIGSYLPGAVSRRRLTESGVHGTNVEKGTAMTSTANIEELGRVGRHLEAGRTGDPDLGPFTLLPGTWANTVDSGWNMIALPFFQSPASPPPVFPVPYRLLVNEFSERLKFQLVDKAVPNRGIDRPSRTTPTS
jgi:hypothetical protein